MLKGIGDLHLLTEIIGSERYTYDADVLDVTIEDHTAILKGLKQRDADLANRAMMVHIRNSRQLTLSRLQDTALNGLHYTDD